jgi:peptide-methionine (S)-S-oxide reductase
MQTATLGMGCFWSPEALFGALPGVIRTRVGYAGGTTPVPVYREMGDHTETVEIDFDSGQITFDSLLEVFWSHHNPLNINDFKGRQYLSILFYRDEVQQQSIQRVKERMEADKGPLDTTVVPYSEFYLAEDRHQKYYLKRFPDAIDKLGALYDSPEDLVNSTLAARLNGLAKGYSNLEPIKREILEWPIAPNEQTELTNLIQKIRW